MKLILNYCFLCNSISH